MSTLQIIPVMGVPEIGVDHHIPSVVREHADLENGDVIVVTSKIISKAEGRVVPLASEHPEARQALIESEAVRVLRRRGPLLITETKHGYICANSGIDFSNVPQGSAALLPEDPDRSARKIVDHIRAVSGLSVAVIVSDTFGRAWRNGVTDIALGCAGIRPILDMRGQVDQFGNQLAVTEICIADEIAAAAELAMGKLNQTPIAIVRGVERAWFGEGSISKDVIRKANEDLFR